MAKPTLSDALRTLHQVSVRNEELVELLLIATRTLKRHSIHPSEYNHDFYRAAVATIFEGAEDIPYDHLFLHPSGVTVGTAPITLKPLGQMLAQLEGWTLDKTDGLIVKDPNSQMGDDFYAVKFVRERSLSSHFHALALQSHEINSKR